MKMIQTFQPAFVNSNVILAARTSVETRAAGLSLGRVARILERARPVCSLAGRYECWDAAAVATEISCLVHSRPGQFVRLPRAASGGNSMPSFNLQPGLR